MQELVTPGVGLAYVGFGTSLARFSTKRLPHHYQGLDLALEPAGSLVPVALRERQVPRRLRHRALLQTLKRPRFSAAPMRVAALG